DMDYIEQTRWLMEAILMRGRKAGPVKAFTNADGTIGTLWNPFSERFGDNAPARDIGLYPDPISKLHGKPTGHFDLRLRYHDRKSAMEEQGVGPNRKSLKDLDPSLFVRSHIRIVRCDMEGERREYFKWLGQNRDGPKKAIEDAKEKGQLEYVQRLYDQYP